MWKDGGSGLWKEDSEVVEEEEGECIVSGVCSSSAVGERCRGGCAAGSCGEGRRGSRGGAR